MQFSAPLTRRLQRNNFRAQLMSYQQARRGLIQFQDSIYQVMRNYLRSLKQLELLLEIQRRAMVIAVRRADQTRELLNQPPEPVAVGATAPLLPPTAAQNLLFALSDLRNAQNNFMSAWLNHYETRMMLYRDLGIMELDDEGMWIDRPLNESDWLEEELCPLPPPIPNHWLHEVDIEGDAEAEPLPPGCGSRRVDIEDQEWPAIERNVPRAAAAGKCSAACPGRRDASAGCDFSGRQHVESPPDLVRLLGRAPRTRAATTLVPPQSRAGGVVRTWTSRSVAARGGRPSDGSDCADCPAANWGHRPPRGGSRSPGVTTRIGSSSRRWAAAVARSIDRVRPRPDDSKTCLISAEPVWPCGRADRSSRFVTLGKPAISAAFLGQCEPSGRRASLKSSAVGLRMRVLAPHPSRDLPTARSPRLGIFDGNRNHSSSRSRAPRAGSQPPAASALRRWRLPWRMLLTLAGRCGGRGRFGLWAEGIVPRRSRCQLATS